MEITEITWQESENAVWFTNSKPICDFCGKKTNNAIELRSSSLVYVSCFLSEKSCFKSALAIMFSIINDDYLLARELIFKPLRPTKNREPIGLSKRYKVMRRDGFQCVLCGASGKESKLEIDHILPVSLGGSDKKTNLQTLCFECNRGKRDKR